MMLFAPPYPHSTLFGAGRGNIVLQFAASPAPLR